MPEFLHLDPADQEAILRVGAEQLGRPAAVLEKDVWVCWALGQLFALPERHGMAFKGGTSLSKVYGSIARFSEDIDVTVDYRDIHPDTPALDTIRSRAERDRVRDRLLAALAAYVHGTVRPFFEEQLQTQFPGREVTIEVDEAGENFKIHYPSALAGREGYLRDHVLIEFGGRNTTVPQHHRTITADLAPVAPTVSFPTADVQVLAAERTFWEKATLMHVECNRQALRASHERWARHWYDLTQLANSPIGPAALADRVLLQSVVDHKKVFFHAADANYDACLAGGFRLVPPDGELLERLAADYEAMNRSGMLHGEPPPFAQIVERLRRLEEELNQPMGATTEVR